MNGQENRPPPSHLPQEALDRVRSLTREEVLHLLEHETGHANRRAMVELLTARLAELDRGHPPTPD